MNYIKHLNGFFDRLSGDERMTAYHISLYLALFQQWNLNRFCFHFQISRTELMWLSRIRSVNTYARCIRQLHQWGYIIYTSSGNLHIGSSITCIRFDTGDNTGNRISGNTGGHTLVNKRTNMKGSQRMLPGKPHNEKKQEVNGQSPYHATRDKDYSEPL